MKPPNKFLPPRPNSSTAALMALALATGSALAVDGVWVVNAGGGNWDDDTKWVDGLDVDLLGDIPGGVGATADFQVSRTSGNITVALNGDRTIGILKIGFFGDGRGLTLASIGKLVLDNGASAAQINFRDGGGNVSINPDSTELQSNLLINNLDDGGNKGFFFTSGLSSTNGHLTITNTSHINSRTKFNGVVSDGAEGNSITYNQTAGWSEFTNNGNTFSGTTTNGGGLLHLGNTAGISLALQNSALNTTGSIAGTATVGLRLFAGINSLTLGGLIGNKDMNATGTGVFSTASSNYNLVTALTLNPGLGKNHNYDGVIANGAANMTLTKTGAGTQSLNGINTFTGATNVNVGTLKLDTLGALDAASSVSIAAGATFDLTAKTAASATYTWNTTSLSASGAATPATITGTALGTIDMGIKPISLTTDGTNPSLTVTGAILALGGNSFTVVVPGSALGAGVYTLISGASITGTVNATASYTGGNGLVGGATGVVSISGGNTVILTVTVGSAYDTWATAKGLTGANNAKTDDPDMDGNNNLSEFAFDGNPLSGTNDGKIVGKIATVGADQVMTLTLPVRTGATFSNDGGDQLSALIDGIYYRIEGSVDLSAFANTITEVTGGDATTIQTGLPALSSGWSYRTFRDSGTVPTVPKTFLRAKISETP